MANIGGTVAITIGGGKEFAEDASGNLVAQYSNSSDYLPFPLCPFTKQDLTRLQDHLERLKVHARD